MNFLHEKLVMLRMACTVPSLLRAINCFVAFFTNSTDMAVEGKTIVNFQS